MYINNYYLICELGITWAFRQCSKDNSSTYSCNCVLSVTFYSPTFKAAINSFEDGRSTNLAIRSQKINTLSSDFIMVSSEPMIASFINWGVGSVVQRCIESLCIDSSSPNLSMTFMWSCGRQSHNFVYFAFSIAKTKWYGTVQYIKKLNEQKVCKMSAYEKYFDIHTWL